MITDLSEASVSNQRGSSTAGVVSVSLLLTSPSVLPMPMVVSPRLFMLNLSGSSAHQENVMSALGVPAMSLSVAMTVRMVFLIMFSVTVPE